MTTSTLRISAPVIISTQPKGPHPEVTRLLAAAIVNRQFRHLLLNDPVQALDGGYQGEEFIFTRSERDLISSIQAKSLSELARELVSSLEISAYSDQYDTKIEIQRIFKAQ